MSKNCVYIKEFMDIPLNAKVKTIAYLLNIKRFITDAYYWDAFHEIPSHISGYDIILSDTHFKIKCVVDHKLVNNIPQLYLESDHVWLVSADIQWNSYRETTYSMVTNINPIRTLKYEDKSNWVDVHLYEQNVKAFTHEGLEKLIHKLQNRPLLSLRRCYVDFFSDHIPLGSQWDARDISIEITNPEDLFRSTKDKFYMIHQLKDHFKEHQSGNFYAHGKQIPFIVARIIKKSLLTNYGKITDTQKYPFCFSVRLQDYSGSIKLVLWENKCRHYYKSLSEGDLVVVRGFRAKSFYHSAAEIDDGCNDDIEIKLNPDPKQTIHKIKGPFLSDPLISGIHPKTHHCLSSTELLKYAMQESEFPERPLVDFKGVILFIGRSERVLKSNGKWDYFQWLYIQDHQQQGVFLKRIMDGFTKLKIRDIIIVSNLLVSFAEHQSIAPYQSSESTPPGDIILTSTNITQFHVVGRDDQISACYTNLELLHHMFPYLTYGQRYPNLRSVPNLTNRIIQFEDILCILQRLKAKETVHKVIYGTIVKISLTGVWVPLNWDIHGGIAYKGDIQNTKQDISLSTASGYTYNMKVKDPKSNQMFIFSIPIIPTLISPKNILDVNTKKSRMIAFEKFLPLQVYSKKSKNDKNFLKDIANQLRDVLLGFEISLSRLNANDIIIIVNNIYLPPVNGESLEQ